MSGATYDPEKLKELVPLALEDQVFFGNSGKKDRERWVLDQWMASKGASALEIVEDEGPDLVVDGTYVEIVEVMQPGRKRYSEYKADVAAFAQGNPPEWKSWTDFGVVLSDGHRWILSSIVEKAKKYGGTATTWVLLVYANYGWSEKTDWLAVRAGVQDDVRTFREIYAITADGNQVIRVKS